MGNHNLAIRSNAPGGLKLRNMRMVAYALSPLLPITRVPMIPVSMNRLTGQAGKEIKWIRSSLFAAAKTEQYTPHGDFKVYNARSGKETDAEMGSG